MQFTYSLVVLILKPREDDCTNSGNSRPEFLKEKHTDIIAGDL